MVLIHDPGFVSARLDIDKTHEQRDFIILVQAVPQKIGESVQIIGDLHRDRFAFKAGQRIAVALISMDEVSLAGFGVVIGEGKAQAGGRISVVAL